MSSPTIITAFLGIVVIIGYIILAVSCIRMAWSVSASLQSRALRLAISTLVLALFFAPAFVAGGHGVGIGPAWFVLATGTWSDRLARIALISLPVVWLLSFTIALIVFHAVPQNNKNKRGQDDQGSIG